MTHTDMVQLCPECGATLPAGDTCQSIFDRFLALEFEDPDYGEVHMLTVACFMIQHGRYSDDARIWIEKQLRAYLEEGVPVQQIRRRAAKEAQQGSRPWKVNRRAGEPAQPKIVWTMTIADVDSAFHDAESYRESIRKWAEITLKEMRNDK